MLLCPISYRMILNFDVTRIPIGIHMTGPRVFGMHTLDGSLQRANFSCLLWSIAKWCTLTWCDPTDPKHRGKRKGRSEILKAWFDQTFVSTLQLKLGEKTILWYRWFQMSFYFALIPGENDPVSLIFFNHQLDSNNSTSLTRNHLSPVVRFHDRNCLWWDPFLWFASGVSTPKVGNKKWQKSFHRERDMELGAR